MVHRLEMGDREQRARRRIVWLLILAAALPLLPGGMLAGLALAIAIAVWLFRAPKEFPTLTLWMLTALVALENLVFLAGYLALL